MDNTQEPKIISDILNLFKGFYQHTPLQKGMTTEQLLKSMEQSAKRIDQNRKEQNDASK